MQTKDKNTVVVSLAYHVVSDPNWQDTLNTDKSNIRIGAGKTFLDLMTIARPSGFLLKTRTAGRMFSVGGVIANSVHGGGKDAGFLYEQVSGLLVMTYDGTIQEVISSWELSNWLCSTGLLGIILAAEIKLIPDDGLEMKIDSTQFYPPTDTNSTSYDEFIQNITNKVYSMVAESTHVEFFYEPYSSTLLSLYTVNSGIPFPNPSNPTGNRITKASYQAG